MATDRVFRLSIECKNKCHEKSPMYVECKVVTGLSQPTHLLQQSCPKCQEKISLFLIAESVGPIKLREC